MENTEPRIEVTEWHVTVGSTVVTIKARASGVNVVVAGPSWSRFPNVSAYKNFMDLEPATTFAVELATALEDAHRALSVTNRLLGGMVPG